ncbi:MAG: hypothetical protein R2750_02295 [Bacteroidales bacterium]
MTVRIWHLPERLNTNGYAPASTGVLIKICSQASAQLVFRLKSIQASR